MLMPTPVVSCVLSMHWHPPWLEWEMCLSQWHAECCYHQCYACGLMRRNIKIKQLCIADIICFNKGGLLLGHFFYLGFIYIYIHIYCFSFLLFLLLLLLMLLFCVCFCCFCFFLAFLLLLLLLLPLPLLLLLLLLSAHLVFSCFCVAFV